MDHAVRHPGDYLRELLIWHDLGASQLAREIDLPCREIVELTAARRAIDKDISEGLAVYFGNPARCRLELQARFEPGAGNRSGHSRRPLENR